VFGLHDGFVAKLEMFKEHFGSSFVVQLYNGEVIVLRNFVVEQTSIYHFIKNKLPQT